MKQQLAAWLCIAAGGALGALGRYILGGWFQSKAHSDFPLGTFLVNVLGCFAFGLLYGWLEPGPGKELRAFVFTGLLGGFTTFATFGFESINLMQRGQQGTALAYVSASVVAGLLAAWLGLALAGAGKEV